MTESSKCACRSGLFYHPLFEICQPCSDDVCANLNDRIVECQQCCSATTNTTATTSFSPITSATSGMQITVIYFLVAGIALLVFLGTLFITIFIRKRRCRVSKKNAFVDYEIENELDESKKVELRSEATKSANYFPDTKYHEVHNYTTDLNSVQVV